MDGLERPVLIGGTTTDPASAMPDARFVQETKVVLQGLRSSLLAVLSAAGADATRPQEMARQFGLNKNLTWKLSRVIRESDALAALAHMPGRPGLRIFLEAMEKSGATAEALDQVKRSIAELDALVRTHSGDRETLEAMVGGIGGASAAARSEAQRKLAFRGNSATWGVQARVQVSCHFAAPSVSSPDLLDVAIVAGLVDFRRLRADTPWAVATISRVADDFSPQSARGFQAVEPEYQGADLAPLMPEFCGRPMPTVRLGPGQRPQLQRIELVEGPVGNTGATTCIAGWCHRGQVARYRSEEDGYGAHQVVLSTPVELVFHDLYVHRSLAFAHSPKVAMYNQLPSGPMPGNPMDPAATMPLHEGITRLGAFPPDVVTPELAWYPRMMEHVSGRLGWKLDEFVGFRVRMAYPPIPTRLSLMYQLDERG